MTPLALPLPLSSTHCASGPRTLEVLERAQRQHPSSMRSAQQRPASGHRTHPLTRRAPRALPVCHACRGCACLLVPCPLPWNAFPRMLWALLFRIPLACRPAPRCHSMTACGLNEQWCKKQMAKCPFPFHRKIEKICKNIVGIKHFSLCNLKIAFPKMLVNEDFKPLSHDLLT